MNVTAELWFYSTLISVLLMVDMLGSIYFEMNSFRRIVFLELFHAIHCWKLKINFHLMYHRTLKQRLRNASWWHGWSFAHFLANLSLVPKDWKLLIWSLQIKSKNEIGITTQVCMTSCMFVSALLRGYQYLF